MKNIRSNSTAALSIMLLLSTTASHGISFDYLKGMFTAAQVTNASKAAVDAVVAHPYISAAAAIAVPVVGIGLYQAGKYAFGKKAKTTAEQIEQLLKPSAPNKAEKDIVAKAATEVDPAIEQTFKDINLALHNAQENIVKMDKDATALVVKEANAQRAIIKQIETQANKVFEIVREIAHSNAIEDKLIDKAQKLRIAQDFEPLVKSIKQLPASDVQIAARNFGLSIGEFIKSNDLTPVIKAKKALEVRINPVYAPMVTQEATKKTVMQRIVTSLPTKTQALIGAAVAAPVIAGAIYAYKNGYLDSTINTSSSLFGSFKNLIGFSKKSAAPSIGN